MKYETLEALVRAYQDGTLTAPLELDNYATYVYANEQGSAEDDENIDKVFGMDPWELLNAALDLLGIPHEHV